MAYRYTLLTKDNIIAIKDEELDRPVWSMSFNTKNNKVEQGFYSDDFVFEYVVWQFLFWKKTKKCLCSACFDFSNNEWIKFCLEDKERIIAEFDDIEDVIKALRIK